MTESSVQTSAAPLAAFDGEPYRPRRASRSTHVPVRGLQYHLRIWEAEAEPERTVVLLHGWMDVSASFQFLVDVLPPQWRLVGLDWRGYGLSDRPAADCYWFPDYLGDLDAVLDALSPQSPVDLVAHSMGGNVAMLYAGVRPARVRRLVNLEGVGMPETRPAQAAGRMRAWLDDLRAGARMRDYSSREAVAGRLRESNPRLSAAQAAFLAEHWAAPRPDGRFVLLGDPAHKLVNPTLYRVDEVLAVWREIAAPVLLVLAGITDRWHDFIHKPAWQRRLLAIRSLERVTLADAGHMLHHDQPEALAALVTAFLRRP